MTARVEIYSTSYCRHCVAARELLDRLGIEYTDHRLDLLPLERDEMLRRTGATSVPQVFVDGTHIGGNDALVEMHERGELETLAAR